MRVSEIKTIGIVGIIAQAKSQAITLLIVFMPKKVKHRATIAVILTLKAANGLYQLANTPLKLCLVLMYTPKPDQAAKNIKRPKVERIDTPTVKYKKYKLAK